MSRSVNVTRTVAADLDSVWAVVADIGNTATYNPVVFESEGDSNAELGSSRRCAVNAARTKWIQEQVVESDDHRYVIEITGGNGAPPMRTNVEIEARPVSAESTEVSMTAHLHPEGIVQRMLTVPAARMMTSVLGRVIGGLDHHIATGERIDPSFKPR